MARRIEITLSAALLAALAACGPVAADRSMRSEVFSESPAPPAAAGEETGGTAARVAAAESDARAARAGLQGSTERVALDTTTSDLSVGRDVALLELAIEHERWLEAFLKEVRERHRKGLASKTDIAQVESRLAMARATRARAQGNLRVSESRYLEVVGEPPPGSDLNQALPAE